MPISFACFKIFGRLGVAAWLNPHVQVAELDPRLINAITVYHILEESFRIIQSPVDLVRPRERIARHRRRASHRMVRTSCCTDAIEPIRPMSSHVFVDLYVHGVVDILRVSVEFAVVPAVEKVVVLIDMAVLKSLFIICKT